MSSRVRSRMVEFDRDRYARVGQVQLGERGVLTPQYSPLLKSKSPDEMEIFLHARTLTEATNSKSCVVRLFDAEDILGTRRSNLTQRRMDNLTRFVEEPFVDFVNNGFPIVDPAPEYLLYEPNQSKWIADNIPKLLSNYAQECVRRHKRVETGRESQTAYRKWKQAHHRTFWTQLSKDARSRNSLIGDIYDQELRHGSPFMLPIVPLITDDKMLEISLQINSVGASIGAKREATFANYFVLPSRKVAHRPTMAKILEYVRSSAATANFFKFKYQNLTASGNRGQLFGYRDFLQEIALLRSKNHNRLFAVLDNGYQAFPSAVVAFDIVSTSITGFDLEGGHGQSPFGWWLDPEEMVHISFEDTLEVFRNSGNVLPCGHATCRSLDLRGIGHEEWNIARRRCSFLTLSNYMSMITEAIATKRTELTIDKINRSDLVRLRKLIPRA